jgi:Glycosyl transferase family 2
MSYERATIVIPTRNRPTTLAAAVRSIVEQPRQALTVVVSDNSTDPRACAEVEAFCRRYDDDVVRYVRPPEPLPMPEHWNWALGTALAGSDASHVAFLTDRMVLKADALASLLAVVEAHPDKIVSYNHDELDDRARPIALRLFPWSGKVLEIDASHLLYLSSRGVIRAPLPRMMNCMVPRGLFAELEGRFGAVFGSISPDFCFCYRSLAIVDSILYLDKALLIQYALDRSQGASYARGENTQDRVDFAGQLGATEMNYAAPVPAFQTIRNAIFHEYAFVKAESGSSRFPEIDPRAYMAAILEDFSQIENPAVRRQMLGVLRDNGWVGAPRARYDVAVRGYGGVLALWHVARTLTRGMTRTVRRMVRPSGVAFAGRLGLPASASAIGFRSAEEAIAYANAHPLPARDDLDHVQQLFEPPGFTREAAMDAGVASAVGR